MLSRTNLKLAQYNNTKILELGSFNLIKKGALDSFIKKSIDTLASSLVFAAMIGQTKATIISVDNFSLHQYYNIDYKVIDLIQTMGSTYINKIIELRLNGYGFKVKKVYKERKKLYKVIVHW